MFSPDWGKHLKRKLVDIEVWREKIIQDTELTGRQKYWWAYVTVSVAVLFYFCRFTCQAAVKSISGKCAKCHWGYTVLQQSSGKTTPKYLGKGRLIYSSLQTHFKKLSHLPFPLAVTAAIRIFTVDCLFMFLPSSDSQDAVKILIVLMARASWNSVTRCLLTTGCFSSLLKMAVWWHYLFCQSVFIRSDESLRWSQ